MPEALLRGFDFLSMSIGNGVAIRSVVLLMVAVFAARVAANHSAAHRSLIWRFALTVLLLLPLASLLLPSLEIPVAASSNWLRMPVAQSAEAITGRVASQQGSGAPLPDGRGQTVERVVEGHFSPLATIWLAGSFLVLARFAAGWLRIERLIGRAAGVTDPHVADEVKQIAGFLGVDGELHVVESAEADVPGTWGVVRRVVILPPGFGSWSRQRRRRVLIHELSHIRRRDPLHTLVGEIAVGLYWWNPLAWYARSQAREESERACDDRVLSFGSRPSEYAKDLLSVARGVGIRNLSAISGGRLRQRIETLFDDIRRDEPGRRFIAVAAVGGAMALWLTGATVVTATPLPPPSFTGSQPSARSALPRWEPQQLRWSYHGQAGGMFLEGSLDLMPLIQGETFIGDDGLIVSFQRDADGRFSSFTAVEREDRVELWSEAGRGVKGVDSLRALVSWLAPDWRSHPDTFIGVLNREPAIAAREVLDSSGSIILGIPGKSRNPETGELQAGWYDAGERLGVFARGPIHLGEDRESITAIDSDGWLAGFAWDRQTRRLRLITVLPDSSGTPRIRSYENGVEQPGDRLLLRRMIEGLPGVDLDRRGAIQIWRG